jgi:hypothetical protein
MQQVTLEGGAQVFVNFNEEKGKCLSCNKVIWWATTIKGKKMPIEKIGSGYVSHFKTCPAAKEFRR